jgi:hypothetical protein
MQSLNKPKLGSAEDELFLQPWFVPKSAYMEIRKILPPSQMLKMRYYFDDYGCLKCGKLNALYCSNGMCKECSVIVRARVALALKRRFKKIGANVPKEPFESYLRSIFGRRPGVRLPSGTCARRER